MGSTAPTEAAKPSNAETSPAVITVCATTNVGVVRTENEDAFVVSEVMSGAKSVPSEEEAALSLSAGPVLLMVCDGMGGAAAGEVASRLAGEVVVGALKEKCALIDENPAGTLVSALVHANQIIFKESRRREGERGMGTTCTAALVIANRLVLAQVGDSRAYLYRDNALRCLTRDQSLAMAMVDVGALSPGEIKEFPHGNIILQALGVQDYVAPVPSELDLEPRDLVLLCSDGLHGPVPDEKIAAILGEMHDLKACVRALIASALEAGGPDNVTVILARHDRTE